MTSPYTNVPAQPSKGGGIKSLVGSQAGNRYTDTFFDQHKNSRDQRFMNGRPWCGPREMAANKGMPDGFVGELQCGEYVATGPEDDRHVPTQTPEDRLASFATAWHAPWFPEFKYFEYQWRMKRITIRYDRALADYTREFREYYLAANKIAVQKGWKSLSLGQEPDFGIVAALGEPYRKHHPRIIQAAQAGDPWLLGFTDEVNVELANLIGYVSDPLGMAVAERFDTRTPEQVQEKVQAVLGADQATLAEMIAKGVAEALAARDKANKARMAKARAGKKKHTPVEATV